MRKDISAMNERELLAELVRQGKRASAARIVSLVLLAAILFMLVFGGYKIMTRLSAVQTRLEQSLDVLDSSLESAKRVFDSIDEETIDSFKTSLENVGDAAQKMGDFIDDLDGLRSTLEQLKETLGGILGFFNRGE